MVDDQGWYYTGDLSIMRDDGYVKIVGRNKDMIIRGGENIYPAEIEGVLNQMEDIIDVQVVGVPSKRLGEEVRQLLYLRKTISGMFSDTLGRFFYFSFNLDSKLYTRAEYVIYCYILDQYYLWSISNRLGFS